MSNSGRVASEACQAFTMTWSYFDLLGTEEKQQRVRELGLKNGYDGDDLVRWHRDQMLQDPALQDRVHKELLARPSWRLRSSWITRVNDLIDKCDGDVMAAIEIIEKRRLMRQRRSKPASE